MSVRANSPSPPPPVTLSAAVPPAAVPVPAAPELPAGAARFFAESRDAFDGRDGQASMGALAAAEGRAPRGLPLGVWSFPASVAVAPVAGAGVVPSGEALVRSLSNAAARCVEARPECDDALLADKLASFVFTDTARDFVAAVRRGERPLLSEIDAASLGRAFDADADKPVHTHMLTLNGRSSWGGLAVFRKDIFPEGFYRTRALGNVAPGMLAKDAYREEKAPLLFEQPYFRWQDGEYALVLGDPLDNAALRLVEHLAPADEDPITLWRGTSEAYDTPEELLTRGDGGMYAAGSMSGFGEELAGVMTTPDRGAAESWAHPTLVRFDFTGQELRQLAREGLLYAGIEYDYLELALLYDRDPGSARGRASVERMKAVEPGLPAQSAAFAA